MTKKRTLLTAGLSLLLGFTSLQAQQVFTLEGKNKIDKTVLQVKLPENMKLTKHSNRNIAMFSKIKTDNAAEINYTIKTTCPKGLTPVQGCLYNKNENRDIYFSGDADVNETAPAGLYDAFVFFYDAYETMYMVVKENIEIKEGAVIEINADEAVNGITYKYYDENNQELFCDRTNTNHEKVEDGTVESLNSNIIISHKDYGNVLIIMSKGYYYVNYEEALFINNLSDKYYIGAGTCATKKDQTRYIFKSVITDFTTQTVKNEPSNLVYKEASFINTPVAQDDLTAHFPIPSTTIFNCNSEATTSCSYNTDLLDEEYSTYKFWIDAPMSDPNSDIEFDVIFKPRYNDYLSDNSWGGTDRLSIKGPGYIGNKNTGVVLFNNGTDEYGAYNTTPEYEYGKMYPYNPYLAFEAEDHLTFGNSAPVCSFISAFYKEENNISGYMKANFVGRYGEVYEASGELVKSTSSQNQLEDGRMEILVPNYNIEVDGIEGENITRLVFDGNAEDFLAPTFHMLSVIDENGKVNDHLANVNGAKIIMVGADYDYTYFPETWFGYFTYKDAAAELYYTVNGYEDDWKKLDVKVVPEKLFEPAYGNFYEVSLDGMEITEPESWIDLKIVLTDESGNFQEQIIRPVIFVENTSTGIKSTNKDNDIDILIINNTIRLSNNEEGQINIYSMDGMNVMSANDSEINIENLKAGAYIVNVLSGNNILNKKFMKK